MNPSFPDMDTRYMDASYGALNGANNSPYGLHQPALFPPNLSNSLSDSLRGMILDAAGIPLPIVGRITDDHTVGYPFFIWAVIAIAILTMLLDRGV